MAAVVIHGDRRTYGHEEDKRSFSWICEPAWNNCSNLGHVFIHVFITLSFVVHLYYLRLRKDTKHSFVSYVKLNALQLTKNRQLWFYGAWSTQAKWPSSAACLGLSDLALAKTKTSTIMGCIITSSMHSIAHISHIYRAELELRLAPRPLQEFQRCKDFNFSKNCTNYFKITLLCVLSTLCICRVCKILVTGSITYPNSVKSWSF